MNGNFWLTIAIQEAITVAEAFVSNANIKPALKSALEKLIADGNAVVAAVQSGK